MVITVRCPSCASSFPVDPAKVPEEGVYARCSVCAGVFFVERPQPVAAGASAGRGEGTGTESEPEPEQQPEPEQKLEPEQKPEHELDAEPGRDAEPGQEQEAEPGAGEGFDIAREETPAPKGEGEGAAAPSLPGFTPGRRDPHDKARRLARVLVSDMIMYNPGRHRSAVEGGSLREDFADEIRRSWEEYVDQVGEDMARSTSYFDDALNEILARGQQVFP